MLNRSYYITEETKKQIKYLTKSTNDNSASKLLRKLIENEYKKIKKRELKKKQANA